MTSRDITGLLALKDEATAGNYRFSASDTAYRLGFGAIGWPWLLISLWGGTKKSKRELLERIGLAPDALPNLGSWKADTGFLHRIVDAVEEIRPQTMVELGAGASTLVCAKALQANGNGQLFSYDQHEAFVAATAEWVAGEGAKANLRHAPLTAKVEPWPGRWYDLQGLPHTIDLLVIDGPPWAIHPFVRGAAECLFDRLSPGGIVLLDDAARPGERIVARQWRERWPEMDFQRQAGSTKGTLVGRKPPEAEIIPFAKRKPVERAMPPWQRAAAAVLIFAAGWTGHGMVGNTPTPAQAASFIEEADASYATSLARQGMRSQLESTHLDRKEIASATGLDVPELPEEWRLADVQVYPSALGMSVALLLQTDDGEAISLFGTRAETPAEGVPMLEQRDDLSIAFWEEGPNAFALTGQLPPERILALAASLAEQGA